MDLPKLKIRFPDNYPRRTEKLEDYAEHRWGLGPLLYPRVPTPFAALLIRFWNEHYGRHRVFPMDTAPDSHREANKAMIATRVHGSSEDPELSDVKRPLFWQSQRRLAAALTKLTPWQPPSEHVRDIADELLDGANRVIDTTARLPTLAIVALGAYLLLDRS